MSNGHIRTGQDGEEIACSWLKDNGYQIIARNWRAKHLEIDVICLKEDQLVFIEVKTARFSSSFFPEMNLSFRKQRCLRQAATTFCNQNPQLCELPMRFDVIAITIYPNQNPEIYCIEDAFR